MKIYQALICLVLDANAAHMRPVKAYALYCDDVLFTRWQSKFHGGWHGPPPPAPRARACMHTHVAPAGWLFEARETSSQAIVIRWQINCQCSACIYSPQARGHLEGTWSACWGVLCWGMQCDDTAHQVPAGMARWRPVMVLIGQSTKRVGQSLDSSRLKPLGGASHSPRPAAALPSTSPASRNNNVTV